MEVTGRVKVIGADQQISASFKKREIVVTTDEQYPQVIMVEFTQDKTDLLNNYAVGDEVKISINLRGREWVNPQGETKYFNSIQGWRIEKMTQAQGQEQAPPMPAAALFARPGRTLQSAPRFPCACVSGLACRAPQRARVADCGSSTTASPGATPLSTSTRSPSTRPKRT